MTFLRGRLIELRDGHATIANERGTTKAECLASDARPGDWVELRDGRLTILTPNRSPDRSLHWMGRILDPRRVKALAVRRQVEEAIRRFFNSRSFTEVRTPLLVDCPGMEPHIRPFELKQEGRRLFLHTSPEFAMKRLLAGGMERIFQLSPAFRDEPPSVTHQPEFTMLEWYRAFAGYEEIMADTEELVAAVAQAATGTDTLSYQGKRISVRTPWPRLRVRDLFMEIAGINLVASGTTAALAQDCVRLGIKADASENWDDIYFKIWLNVIEPRLPADRAVFVTDYPASQAALAVLRQDADGSRWAKRFEAYVGGIELCNAFEELTDPVEQRRRFEEDMELRERTYGPAFPRSPIDEDFLSALEEGIPPSGGNALGVDRLVMLAADEPEIGYTLWLPRLS